jgi:hypothetical protein
MKNLGLLYQERRATDYIHGEEERLGGSTWSRIIEEQDGKKSWFEFAPEPESQWKGDLDTNGCVSFSKNNQVEYLANQKIKVNPNFKKYLDNLGLLKNNLCNFSDRRTSKGSGTDPEQGNYISAVEDYVRKFLFCPEDLWSYPQGMSRAEFYSAMPDNVRDYGKKVEPVFALEDKYVQLPPYTDYDQYVSQTLENIYDSLSYSPVWVSVMVPYEYKNNLISGEAISNALRNLGATSDKQRDRFMARFYGHRVTIYGAVKDVKWLVHDHYQNQFIEFEWNYLFGSPKIASIVEKVPNVIDSDYVVVSGKNPQYGRAMLFKDKVKEKAGTTDYISFATGDVLKALPALQEYFNAKPVQEVDEPPQNTGRTLAIVEWDKWNKFNNLT